MAGHENKIRCVLNKCDGLTESALIRVYGALMWALGKVVKSPEVWRVYIGSFWGKPHTNPDTLEYMDAERAALIDDLKKLGRTSAVRKCNELLKRARMLRVHTLIINHLKTQFGWFGKDRTQQRLIDNLFDELKKIQASTGEAKGDFPPLKEFKEKLQVGLALAIQSQPTVY